jgi:hypothetical protein|tara:strand:- start:628 stop:858 length:231 start_codon:yes stop_codon:yes gene_type:complete
MDIHKILDEREAYHNNNDKRQKIESIQTLADIKPSVLEAYRHECLRREIRHIRRLIDHAESVQRIKETKVGEFTWK